MPFLIAGRGPVAAGFLPCFETFCRSPVAGSSQSSPLSIHYTSRRTYAQPASRPVEDQDNTNDEPVQRANSGPSTTARRGGMSDEERAKWAFTTKIHPTPYDILHLPKTASKHDIKKHYYRLAMIYHPDANHPSASTDNFMSLRNAYNLLKDESSRVRYNRTGVGWNSSASSSSGGGGMGTNWNDELMKEQIRRRAYGPHRSSSSSAWGSGRGEAGYSQARWGGTAGDSDYGFAGYAHAGPDTGNRRGNYTSNVRFIGSVAIVSVLFAMFQYDRASKSAESHHAQLRINHLKASEALAEARHDARLYGAERRDRIRRYVRSLEVEREYERLMSESEGVVEGGEMVGAVDRRKEDASAILHGSGKG
ncbi:hypothetical protein FFLO_01721 [Filobasidium floriforme]|uniref:J domain-containing protein n=1 Tax=Filobasidium floriforme TaxID=5210 RepID=A0A8K0NUP3_9TREE|nr:uncharacterized protein HD553DRAFT_334868 [Filobasidium floriforme]KAG7562892.1 hypothetical protein FFLO_01721 [Filobasidium floriforme]KAH8086415.1 hypothetical protein HD553DRAFT_334868 [Filobasidium floriforme]